MLTTMNQIADIIFSSALFINALLFIPQMIKIIKAKTAHDVSLITFIGFWLIQCAIVWHAILYHDLLLLWGYLFSMAMCGGVIVLTFIYRHMAIPPKLQDQLELLDNVLALMPGHVFWVDLNGRYLGCNNQQAKSAGLASRKDIIGKSNADLPWNMYADQLPEALDNINQTVIRTHKLITIEEPAVLKDGTAAIFLSNKVPLHNSQGKVIGMAGISIDITERKKSEEELKKAKMAAEAGERAKTDFLYNMRHDLRTPFSGLLSMACILEDKETDPEKKLYLGSIAESAEILLSHLNDILEYIQSDSGHLVLQEKSFDVNKLLHDLYTMMQLSAQKKHLLLTYICDENLPVLVHGDFLRTQRILIHVLANAIKFTAQGKVTLQASLVAAEKNKVAIKFTIEDTGIGIPKDKQALIFEQFQRLTPSYQNHHPGTGLGLCTVKRFLNDLGGELGLYSQVGEGARFELIIPYQTP